MKSMKLVRSDAYIIADDNPLKKIEIAGRTCYKSESNITDESAEKFVANLIKRKHFAMLEHAEITFAVDYNVNDTALFNLIKIPFVRHSRLLAHGKLVDYVTVSLSHIYNVTHDNNYLDYLAAYVAGETDHLAWCESFKGVRIIDVHEQIKLFDDPEMKLNFWKTHGSVTMKFVCDRGVSHELVRHRCSFAQESTRYCNYASGKHNREIVFVQPSTFDQWDTKIQDEFLHQLECAESAYMYMIDNGLAPQQARAILPNALKTEVIMTAPIYQWDHFFNLRSKGTTGAPHPDMKEVADTALATFKSWESQFIDR